MLKEKRYPFTQKGIEECFQHKSYIDTLENHIELLPVALLLVIGISALLTSPMSTAVAYKTIEGEVVKVAFKYVGGF